MAEVRPITVLHLSDVQFGNKHLFGRLDLPTPDARYDTLYTRLTDDLKRLRREHGLAPDLVLITGDLAETGLPSEFREFLKFAESLVDFLKLSRDRIAIIPGNHDINRNNCGAYFDKCNDNGEQAVPPYWPKWEYLVERVFKPFYNDVPSAKFSPDQPWTVFEVRDLSVVVAGLNSTMAESHETHFGYVGEHQLRWFADKLEAYKRDGWLRLAALHHNIREAPTVPPEEHLQDAEDLFRLLDDKINVFFHGHSHDAEVEWTRHRVPILATGSAALAPKARPLDVPNQYQIVQLWPDRFNAWCRVYIPTEKHWARDYRTPPNGNEWTAEEAVQFQSVGAAFPGAARTKGGVDRAAKLESRTGPHDQREDFLTRVERVCRLRQAQPADIERLQSPHNGLDYLCVTVRDGGFVRETLVAACEHGVDAETVDRFAEVYGRYRSANPAVSATLVCGDSPTQDTLKRAMACGIQIKTKPEYDGLIDFRDYVGRLTDGLARDPLYPPSLYVKQRMTYEIAEEEQPADDAIAKITEWLQEPQGRFVLVLGQFGTGKTFLLREMARRLGSTT